MGVANQRIPADRGADPVRGDLSVERGPGQERELTVAIGLEGSGATDLLVPLRKQRVQILPGPAEQLLRLEGDRRGVFAQHRQRGLSSDRDARLGLRTAGAGVVEVAAEPAAAAMSLGAGGVPDVHRREVASVGVGISHTLQDRQLAALVQFVQRRERGIEAETVGAGEGQRPVGAAGSRNRQARPSPVVLVRAEGHHRVQPVVAATQLHDHEHAVLVDSRPRRDQRVLRQHRGVGGALHEPRHRRRHRRERDALPHEASPRVGEGLAARIGGAVVVAHGKLLGEGWVGRAVRRVGTRASR